MITVTASPADALLASLVPPPIRGSPRMRAQVMLHLQDMVVAPEDFAACELPNLVFLRLICCGDRSPEAVEALLASCPKLTREGCICFRGPGDPVGDDGPNKSRAIARRFRFPEEDLAGCSLAGVIDALERGYSVR